jgi:fructose-bisphosphate aldolase class II
MTEALKESIENKYAVGGFVALDHSFCEAIILAAEEKGVPVILMVPDGGFKLLDLNHFFSYLVPRIERSTAPIVLHLDHGESFEMAVRAIHYGFSSVMIDGSSLPLEENIALTQKVKEVAHAAGISVSWATWVAVRAI